MSRIHFSPEGRQPVEVRLFTELWKREPPRLLQRDGHGWSLELGELPVDRLEYELELGFDDGTSQRAPVSEPSVGAPFGRKSVLVLEAYRAPEWVTRSAPRGTVEPLELPSSSLGASVLGQLWSAAGLGPEEAAPLLIAHDGPEYARFSSLLHFLEVAVDAGRLPRLRAALLAPRARNEDYSASATYSDALARELVPALSSRWPTTRRVGLGASLGALAMLHAHRTHPDSFDALVLQSGSYFQHELDVFERGFAHFARIDAFVREVASTTRRPVPVALTCGTAEENFANNQSMARVLEAQGYPLQFVTARDGHTWICWRDTLAAAFQGVW